MNKKILIVEDQFVEANDLQLMLIKAGYEVIGIARSVQLALEMIAKARPDLVLLDIFLKGKLTGIDLARQLTKDHIPFIYLSANSNEDILAAAKKTEPYGFIVKPFRAKDLFVTLEIAQYRHEHSREARHRREVEVLKQLEQEIAGSTGWKIMFHGIAKVIQREIPFDYLAVDVHDMDVIEDCFIGFLRIGFNEYQDIGVSELATITGTTQKDLIRKYSSPGRETISAFFNQQAFEDTVQWSPRKKLLQKAFDLKSLLTFPLLLEDGKSLNLSFYSRRQNAYSSEHIDLLYRCLQVLSKISSPNSNGQGSTRTSAKKDMSLLQSPGGFEGMIGSSHLLLNIFDLIARVAPVDTSVLVLGESGTGKERIAECIHTRSPRQRKPFVKMNCAALPASLIESELFGHEKGSFTGALEKRMGKFEQANGGTIFLDEIGEMPVDLQVKLLRVLQEKEIEPIGGKSTVKIDVRVIAATNRNLEKEIGEGRFRLDLYYRLNVFPIVIPPLRDRVEDIPDLAQHFINIYNRKSGKKIVSISDNVLKSMMSYSWPGNIRELENLIERSIILAEDSVIDDISLPTTQPFKLQSTGQHSLIKTIHENERDYIIRVLKECDGKIWGPGGAAELLGIPPSTLKSKMKKLGIEKDNF